MVRFLARVSNITGMERAPVMVEGTKEHAKELNLFYKRCDSIVKTTPTSTASGSGPQTQEETPNICFHRRGVGGHLQRPWGTSI